MPKDQLNKVLELLDDIEDEATNMIKKDFYFIHVIYQLLQQLELIDDDVASNLEIEDDASYMVFLQKSKKTTNLLTKVELKYTREAMQWPNDWLPEEEVKQLDLTQPLQFGK